MTTALRPLRAAGLGLVLLGVAARLSNGWTFPPLRSYDAYSHFAYILVLAETGRVPLASEGWSYFHPPLYYALMALPWRLLGDLDPLVRLQVGTLAVAALGLLHAVVAWRVLGRRDDADPVARWSGAAFPLFVPVMLYSAGFLGNEGLAAVLCSASLLALLRTVEAPTTARAATLGLLLGLAMLAKFSAAIVVAAAVVSLGLRAMTMPRRGHGRGLLVALSLATLVSGPFYARNVVAFGDPFAMAREHTFLTAYVEGNQPRAARGAADYLTVDPVVLRRPVWPRGASPFSDPAAPGLARSARESVWTGLYANAWFDGFGGWVLPPVTSSEASRRAGQALLTLALLPTALLGVGLWSGLRRLRTGGWDDGVVVFGATTVAALALVVYGTRAVPIAAAVKATYLAPACVAFAFWFALGLAALRRHSPAAGRVATGGCAALAVLSLLVFWQGLLFDPARITSEIPRYDDALRNQRAVVLHAGGARDRAREAFREAAARSYHLAVENLGYMAAADGQPGEALSLLRRAARLQREQVDAGAWRSREFLDLAAAETAHSVAVVLHELGRPDDADAEWSRALDQDPTHAESRWSRTIARLESAIADAADAADPARAPGDARAGLIAEARLSLQELRDGQPGFEPAWAASLRLAIARQDCDEAAGLLRAYASRPGTWLRPGAVPAEAGSGAGLSATIGRRRLIDSEWTRVDPEAARRACGLEIPPTLRDTTPTGMRMAAAAPSPSRRASRPGTV